MPIYEYACDSCHNRFEVQQKLSDPPVVTCSKCGNAVKKLISSPAIMFKGSGWYITDYSDKMKPPTSGEGGEGKPQQPEAKTPAGEAKTSSSGTGNGTGGATPSSTPASSSSGTSSGGSNTPSTPANSSSST